MTAICVVGSFMMDMRVGAPRFPLPGETVVGTTFSTIVGGKGFNQAVAAARAGARVAMIGAVGQDAFGQMFVDALVTEDIDSSGVARIEGQRTGVGLPIVIPSGENSIIVVPQANDSLSAQHIAAHSEQISHAKILMLQLENPVDAVAEAARIARAAGVTVMLNPAPYSALPAELLANVDLLIPNENELSALAGLEPTERSLEELQEIALGVATQFHCELVVTAGSQGAICIEADGRVTHVPAYPATAVDTVGAGDTFCGNLAMQLAEGASLTAAARFANAAASIAVSRSGSAAAVPYRAEVEQKLKGG